jgi:cell division protein FtsW (lipid II flippase)
LPQAIATVAGNPFWLFLLGAAIAIRRSRRLGIFLSLLVIYFGILNTAQFQYRQVFHHELWAWIGFGVIMETASSLFHRVRKLGMSAVTKNVSQRIVGSWTDEQTRIRIAIRGAMAVLIVATIPVTIVIARNYQQARIHTFIDESFASAQISNSPRQSSGEAPDILPYLHFIRM